MLEVDFKVGSLIASFFGAMAYAVVLKVRSPIEMLAIVFVGMIVAYFLGPLIVDQLGRLGFAGVNGEGLQNAAGFIAGLSGMAVCNGILAIVGRFMGRGGEEGA